MRAHPGLVPVAFLLTLLASTPIGAQTLQFDTLGQGGFSTGGWVQGQQIADVNGDGAPDIVLGAYRASQSRRLYLGDGWGGFTEVSATNMPSGWLGVLSLALGDVDDDGDLDSVWGADTHAVQLLINDGSGVFAHASSGQLSTPTILYTKALLLADYDGDGDLDLAVGNGQKPSLLYLGDGHGTFSDATANLPVHMYSPVVLDGVAGDFDGDGAADLAFACQGQNLLYLNDGSAHFSDATATHLPSFQEQSHAVVAGDLDRDGDLDLIFGNTGNYVPALDRCYLNDGTGHFTDATATHMPIYQVETEGLALADLDGDGYLDLLTTELRGFMSIYLNDGSGHLVDASDRIAQDALQEISASAADLDRDGDADVVLGCRSDALIHWNLFRHLHAPSAPRIGMDFALEYFYRPGFNANFAIGQPALSFAIAQVPLPPFGQLGLDPAWMLLLAPVHLPQGTGRAVQNLPVPNDSTIVGGELFFQALLVDPLAGSHLSPLVSVRIGS